MKKSLTLFSLLSTLIATATSSVAISASASDNFVVGGDGVKILYDEDRNSGDYGWVMSDNGVFTPGMYTPPTGDNIPYLIVGFDTEPTLEEITRMGFYVTYRKQSNWDKFWQDLFPTIPLGKTTTESFLIKSDRTYTFLPDGEMGNYFNNMIPGYDATNYQFSAIGKVSSLLNAEEKYKSDFNIFFETFKSANPNFGDLALLNYSRTGSYKWRTMYHEDKLNDPTKSFTQREWYAIIPMKFVEEAQPESIKAYDIHGKTYDDGLDDDGKPFTENPGSNEYYIDVTVAKDAGIAINGKNAKVTKVTTSGYTSGNDTAVLLVSSDWDYDTQKTINAKYQHLIIQNGSNQLNWTISNDARYLFVKYMAETTEEAQQIKVRIYYTNDDYAPSWRINVKGELGFLPKPYQTTIAPKDRFDTDLWATVMRLLMLAGIAILAIYVVSIIFKGAYALVRITR